MKVFNEAQRIGKSKNFTACAREVPCAINMHVSPTGIMRGLGFRGACGLFSTPQHLFVAWLPRSCLLELCTHSGLLFWKKLLQCNVLFSKCVNHVQRSLAQYFMYSGQCKSV